ncbi:hypothetical protein EJ06DRAFT_528667 [Trichodelitschia bisporula]|uniref:Uncharacterized protein n=1 Tax=Trichodelitschia bisporula TaxID=703511 RepID=A0A6G1I2Z0_9PEZI|nr:hypothetical protein EJ06DRAFT_528667 [Trichodelitschia bisporula]
MTYELNPASPTINLKHFHATTIAPNLVSQTHTTPAEHHEDHSHPREPWGPAADTGLFSLNVISQNLLVLFSC